MAWFHRNAEKKSYTIFGRILRPLAVLAVLNVLAYLVIIGSSGVLTQLNQNRFDVFEIQADNRRGYLQSQMTEKWIKLDDLATYINNRTDRLIRSGRLDLTQLDSSGTECAGLLLDVLDQTISTMYSKQVSGIYIVFNTHDLSGDIRTGTCQDKTGLHIRDNDPRAAASVQHADLLLECAPVRLVREKNLSTDRDWEPVFRFSENDSYGDWLTEPYNTALTGTYPASDCGYWTIRDNPKGEPALSYTIPLVLPDGTVYGVLGVELLSSYLATQLPSSELGAEAVYALMMSEDLDPDGMPNTGTVSMISARDTQIHDGAELTLQRSEYGGYTMNWEEVEYELAVVPLTTYSRNAPFESQHWFILAMVPQRALFSFTNHVRSLLMVTAMLILVFGFAAILFASWSIARPIRALREELEASWRGAIPSLSATGIIEVDDFAQAITNLSKDVVNSSRRFLSIMKMSSIDMGGYEVDEKTDFVFVTENFFRLFGLSNMITADLTPAIFMRCMDRVRAFCAVEEAEDGSFLYSVVGDQGTRYIHVKETRINTRRIGIAEDVTREIQDRKRIEHERDYDLLTGIYNRRAFFRYAGKLMEDPNRLGTAVVIMIDLDDLKSINDTYGHEWGDNYILAAARCIREHVSPQSVSARVSGDEFNILMYGFANRQEARKAVERLRRGFTETTLGLPDGNERRVSASGGVVFVDEEAAELNQLIKYADFAMYLVKHAQKGSFGEFDREKYYATELEQRKRSAFRRIIREQKVYYAFQPIVDARTAQVHACEALMRVKDDTIHDVGELLRIAREEDALGDVERITWNHALAGFRQLTRTGAVGEDVRIFINSQVGHILPPEEQQDLIKEYSELRERTVMEVVETDDYSAAFEKLKKHEGELFASTFALDDYGTGYNSERNLLELMPRYIKLDMSLVREVHRHEDRQMLIRAIVSFAHARDMLILGEGVETLEELSCLLDLNVDLFQGYLLARPAPVPGAVSPEAVEMILKHAQKQN